MATDPNAEFKAAAAAAAAAEAPVDPVVDYSKQAEFYDCLKISQAESQAQAKLMSQVESELHKNVAGAFRLPIDQPKRKGS